MQQFAHAIVWALINSLWQSGLLWLFYILFFKQVSPASKKQFLLSAIAIQCLVTAGFVLFKLNSAIPQYALGIHTGKGWEYLLLLLYGSLLFIKTIGLGRDIKNINRWKQGLQKPPASLQLFTKQTALLLGVKEKVELWITDHHIIPQARGLFKSIVILPSSLLVKLSPTETEALILHELAHIRHKDILSNILVVFSNLVYYFNPGTLALIRELKLQRELLCDETVINFRYSVSDYCNALYLTTTNYLLKPALVLGSSGKDSDLFKRIKWMSERPRQQNRSVAPFLLPLAISFLLAGLFSGSTGNSTFSKETVTKKIENTATNIKAAEIPVSVETSPVLTITTKKPSKITGKRISDEKKEKKTATKEITEPNPDLVLVNFVPGDGDREVMIIEESSNGQTTKVLYLIKTRQGKTEIIPIIQNLQTPADSLQLLNDSTVAF